MPKPEILPRAPSAAPLWIFDTCQLGVVLRAVLAVQLLLCLAAAYTSQSVQQWRLQPVAPDKHTPAVFAIGR